MAALCPAAAIGVGSTIGSRELSSLRKQKSQKILHQASWKKLASCCQGAEASLHSGNGKGWEQIQEHIGRGVLSLAAAAAVSLSPASGWGSALASELSNPALPDVSILTAGNPQKDARALLRNALPIDNKPIQDIQRTLEVITDSLKQPGARGIEAVDKNVRQATRILNSSRDKILADVAINKKAEGQQLLANLIEGLQGFQGVNNKDEVVKKQKQVLDIVGDIEEAMVASFPYEISSEVSSMPLLKGRATVEMKIKVRDNPNLKSVTMQMVLDGYNAPATAGNFLDLVQRGFYNGMEIQRADGFVVQTGDPEGPEEGFVDPGTGKLRTIPLEIKVAGDPAPLYHDTLEDLGRYRAQTALPFNAFGTLAMAREEFNNDSASSQIFWLLKESELTPSSANILDGRYAVFGYVVDNEEYLADLKVGDVIESIRCTQGLDNLVNSSASRA